jgi:sugar phosphate isomerase/epimerase
MARSAIQLYTLRAVETPLPELLTKISDAGFEGIEYANRVANTDVEVVADALDKAGLKSAAAHVGIDRLEDDLDSTIELYRSLGCEHLVVPWLDPDQFETTETIEATADRLQSVAEEVADHGMDFSYHNHDHEFVDVGGETAFDRLADATADPVGFEIDCGWAAAGGVDPASLLDRLGDRVSLIHVSDADEAGTPTEVGDGVLNVPACADAAREAGVEWAVYEHDDPADAMNSMTNGANVLEEF